MSKVGKKEGGPTVDSGLAGPRLPNIQAGPAGPLWDRNLQYLGLFQMHAAHSAHIRLIRAMLSALLAARQLLGVPSPGSGEGPAFQRQGQGRTRPCGASRIRGSQPSLGG